MSDNTIWLLTAPSTVRTVRMLDTQRGDLLPLRVGTLLPVPGLEDEHDETIDTLLRPRLRAWSEKEIPRFVTIGEDRWAVYTWPLGWRRCREVALYRFVRRVGRLVDNELILDGHYFFHSLSRSAENSTPRSSS